jgi:PEP-CTERM motif
MNRLLLAAAVFAASAMPSAAAIEVSVENIGSIFNESLALPAEDTPGSGIGFQQFFEFSLPVREEVTMSVSDSGIGSEKIVGGVFSLNNHTTTGSGPLFIPAGSLIDSSPLSNFAGGQEAIVGPNTLTAGNYFAEVTGTSGASPIHLAIDGTVTASSAIPEPSTWVMLIIGAGAMAWGAATRRKVRELIA